MKTPFDATPSQNMAAYSYYPTPTSPPTYQTYYYSTSTSTSPSPDDVRTFYPPQYQSIPIVQPVAPRRTSAHVRSASFSAPRMSEWRSPPGYPPQAYYTSQPVYSSPLPAYSPPGYEHVSTSEHIKSKARRFSMSGNGGSGNGNPKRRASVRSRTHRIFVDDVDEAENPPVYTYIRPRPMDKHQAYQRTAKANSHFFYNQVPNEEVYESPKADPRPRRASHSTGTRPSQPQESKPRKSKPEKTHREATEADRLRHNIGPGYSTKNWDPSERPIILLGSVFDANSVGNYIYDWTVALYKSGTPMSEVAGDLWVLLIKFAGRLKRAEAGISHTRSKSKRIAIQDAINKGQMIWGSFETLLDQCEKYMWAGATKHPDTGETIMPKDAGCELVKGFFGRDRKLHRTEKLMQQLRSWILDFGGHKATATL